MAGIYIHFPFCKQACYYCDFHFSTQLENKGKLVEAICEELALQKEYLSSEPVETIYFGGGTPSLMDEKELHQVFNAIQNNFRLEGLPEITLEANPDDLSLQNLSVFKKVGINRLSIGIQSFDDSVLKYLNRAHSGYDALRSVRQAHELGFTNISIDLIFAIPGQTDEQWIKNIQQAIALAPQHISCYSLTIEEKTVFGNWKKKGKLVAQSDDVAARQMEILMTLLSQHDFEQYEISNFAKPGFYSRHNSNYWKQKKYLGVGPSAHSFNLVSRQFNIKNNWEYIRSLSLGKIPCEVEMLSHTNTINEYIMTSLRTAAGCDLNFLYEKYQYDLPSSAQNELKRFYHLDLLRLTNHHLLLTPAGKLVADKIAADLFIEE